MMKFKHIVINIFVILFTCFSLSVLFLSLSLSLSLQIYFSEVEYKFHACDSSRGL